MSDRQEDTKLIPSVALFVNIIFSEEGELINLIQSTENDFEGLVINPAAFTHTSVAILDALRAISKPKIEIHLSSSRLCFGFIFSCKLKYR